MGAFRLNKNVIYLINFFIAIVIGLVVLVPVVSFSADSELSKTYFQKAEAIHNRNPVPDKILLRQEAFFLSKSIEADPAFFDAWNNLGDINEQLGRYENALRCYTEAARLRPESGLSYFGLGDVYLKLGRYEKAVESYENGLALQHDPDEVVLTKRRLQSAKILANKTVREGQIVPKETIVEIMRSASIKSDDTSEAQAIGINFGEHLIHFDFEKYDLDQKSRRQLEEITGAMIEIISTPGPQKIRFEINGHTDERGSIDYNMRLGKNRSLAVKEYVSSMEPSLKSYLSSKSYGESMPVSPNAITEEEHARNRRVEIKMYNEMKGTGGTKDTTLTAESKSPSGLSLNFKVWRIKEKGPDIERQQLVSKKGVLYSNDHYQFSVRPNQDCYVYIYQTNSNGGGKWLFPKVGKQPENPFKGERSCWIPDGENYFQLEQNEGEEAIYVVASQAPAYDLEHLIENPSDNGTEEIIRIKVRGLGGIRKIQSEKNVSLAEHGSESLTDFFSQAGEFFIMLTYIHLNK